MNLQRNNALFLRCKRKRKMREISLCNLSLSFLSLSVCLILCLKFKWNKNKNKLKSCLPIYYSFRAFSTLLRGSLVMLMKQEQWEEGRTAVWRCKERN